MRRALFFLFLAVPCAASAEGIMYVSPRTGDYLVSERFDVRILADSGTNLVSAAEGELAFNPAALEVISISTRDSIIDSWSTAPIFSNTEGYIRFSGWTGAQFEGTSGHILTITFVAKRQMRARLDILSGALLSETGTSNILTGVQPGVYEIGLSTVSHDDPEILGAATAYVPTTIIAVPDQIRVGDRISIQGNTVPDALLTLRLQSPSGMSEHPLASGNDGRFVFVSDPVYEAGVYRAKTIVLDGSRGDESEQIAISVAPNMVAAVFAIAGEYGLSILGALFSAIILGIGGGYLFHRAKRRS